MERYIDIDQFLATLQYSLGQGVARDKPIILKWIYDGVYQCGGAQLNLKKKTLDIADLQVEIPQDLLLLSNIYLVDGDRCVEPFYDKTIKCCHRYEPTCDPRFYVAETMDHYCFSSNISDDSYTQAHIVYYSVAIDDNGFPLVPHYMEEAVWAYVTYKWLFRNRRKYQKSPSRQNPINLTEMQMAEQSWKLERRRAKAIQKTPENYQAFKQIGNDFLYRMTSTFPTKLDRVVRAYYQSV